MRRSLHLALTACVGAEVTAVVAAPWSEPGESLHMAIWLLAPALVVAALISTTGVVVIGLRSTARAINSARQTPRRPWPALTSGASALILATAIWLRPLGETTPADFSSSSLALTLALCSILTILVGNRLQLAYGSVAHLAYWRAVALCVCGSGLGLAAIIAPPLSGSLIRPGLRLASLTAFILATRYLSSTGASRHRMALLGAVLLFTLGVDALIPCLLPPRPFSYVPSHRGRKIQSSLIPSRREEA